jgi:saccharopine dehydrogenase-like NADP-dependent oxidoreductase
MNVVLLGLGLQGRAALYDLIRYSTFENIIAIDLTQHALDWTKDNFDDARLKVLMLDVAENSSLTELLGEYKAGVVIDLLPIQFIPMVSAIAIESGWHFVNTYYTHATHKKLHDEAVRRELTILPEFGLDPGIDLVMAGHGISKLDKVTDFFSYGTGIPEPKACTNVLNYKISWIFEGVLDSYYRAARIMKNGKIVTISPNDIFNERWLRMINIEGVGTLECLPNGDVTKYVELAGIHDLRNGGRYSMRYPGHRMFWYVIAKLGLLEDKIVKISGRELSQRHVLAQLLGPLLQYSEDERDMVVLRVEVRGEKNGQMTEHVYELIDYRDLKTGFFAMSRTVGFVASIGAQMIQSGIISKRGLCNPMFDVPYRSFMDELKKRNIETKHKHPSSKSG